MCEVYSRAGSNKECTVHKYLTNLGHAQKQNFIISFTVAGRVTLAQALTTRLIRL